ncbi:Uncharacterized conserved protein YukE [Amycolatopsis xylanica]|uniref:Uncharacterized conserved protein YukE n=1 Tax=Amycolatopsis xylanica TaxID=589385 RepID=A0A1H2ZZL2_9PSEU|nr:PE domain-containing protein [Amycolatopsis xylanica]SDX22631.1 Uncharacterized conserved protein YukE [Amycolatopsis xylanica]
MSGTTAVHELGSTVPTVPGMADIQVDPDKLLAVAKIVEDQANALQDKLRERLGELHIDAPSDDAISTYATKAWNSLVSDGDQSYAKRVRSYVQGLRDLVEQLREAAKRYKLDEDEKTAAFGDRGVHRA